MIFGIASILFVKVYSQCTPLLVNDFKNASSNAINGLSFDDNSLQQFKINNNVLEIIPKPNGYYYETGFCAQYRQKWTGVELQLTSIENTEFFLNFQTSNKCNSTLRNNYAASKSLSPTFKPDGKTTIRFPFPSSAGNTGEELTALSIENLAPFKQTVQIYQVRLICEPIQEKVEFVGTKPKQPNSAIRLYCGLGLFVVLIQLL